MSLIEIHDFTADVRRARSDTADAVACFGKQLRAERLRAGLSQREVAEGIQSTTAYISRIERGLANPPLLAMVRLAEAVGRRCRFEIG